MASQPFEKYSLILTIILQLLGNQKGEVDGNMSVEKDKLVSEMLK